MKDLFLQPEKQIAMQSKTQGSTLRMVDIQKVDFRRYHPTWTTGGFWEEFPWKTQAESLKMQMAY